MAFTRKALKAMSLSDEQIDNIIDMHAEVVDALKDELKTAKEDAGKLGEVQKELDALKAKDGDDYKTKYEKEHSKKLLIRRIYEMIPSQMENKKKRIVAQEIRGKEGDRFSQYAEEFEYLVSSGISLAVHAISNPHFPLSESLKKNLLKLYLNDVGLLKGLLYQNNIRPILDDIRSINLGSVYESVVAQELRAHGHKLFYYDNRKQGEVDYLIDDHTNMSAHPIEVKSGKNYTVHSALNNLITNTDYNIVEATVISNERRVHQEGHIIYMPIYFIMFMEDNLQQEDEASYVF